MKTIVKKLAFLPFLLFMFMFIGCQEEVNEINLGNENEEVLVASSYVVSLMKYTSTKDGSSDNILDKASCFNIQLPVNVFVNGLEIIVDSEEDFEVIEKVFDKYYDDDDYLEYVFPIVIILSDYTEITIGNKDQLEEYVAKCSGDTDDDIECVDFKYPISYSIFNTNNNLFDTITIHNDKEMYRFINNLTTNDVISLDFPITLVYTDEEETIVNSMSELENALAAGAEFCDEDDDDDYGDDDFDLERLNELLIKCPWLVHDVRRNDTSLTQTYVDYLMSFKEDGTAKVRTRNGEIITGTWVTEHTSYGVKLKLEFESFVDFTLEWFVHDIDYGRIKLISEGGNRIILEKKCDITFDHTKEKIRNILKECLWRVERLHIDGVNSVTPFIGTPIKFFDNGVAKLRINGELVEGEWALSNSTAGTGFFLELFFYNYPDLNFAWHIKLLEGNRIKLANEKSEMILHRVCPNEDDDVTFINNVLIEGLWQVAKYETPNGDLTDTYNDYQIGFHESGKVFTEGNGQNIIGSWISYRNDGKLRLGLNFEQQYPFSLFNFRWKILEINKNRIVLVDFSSTGSIERKLVLEK